MIRTERWPEPEACLQILKKNQVVYSLTSMRFKIGGNLDSEVSIPVGQDITGAGKPDAVIGEWSGGAHCCFTLHVFELGTTFKKIGEIKADHSNRAMFADPNHNGNYEFDGNDWAFAYWRASFAASPAPRIVLKYRAGRYRLALDLMRAPAPSPEEFAALVDAVRSDDGWSAKHSKEDCDLNCGVPVSLWTDMLQLMYTGHADQSWRLFDESWPSDQDGKQRFAEEFCKQLRSSRYWRELQQAVGPCPPPGQSVPRSNP